MPRTAASKKNRKVVHSKSLPPGRLKIADALRSLLEKKDFNSITTAEIARTAGVTEALIYKYFRDKRDLLHQVLAEYFEQYMIQFEKDLKGARGSLNKIRKTIWSHINVYSTDRVFAKILLLEVRSNPDYFKSRPYKLVKKYSRIVRDIIEEGMKSGEIRSDLSSSFIEQAIFGCIEYVLLTSIIFNRELSPDSLTEHLCGLIFKGIAREKTA